MKKKLFTVIIALLLAVATPLTFAAMFSGCTKDPAAEYVALESNAMHQMINNMFESEEPAADLHAAATVEVTLSDLLFELMELQELNWIDSVSMDFDLHQNDTLANVLSAVSMNSKPLLSYEGIVDSLSGLSYITIPTISDYYVEIADSTASGISELKQVLAQLNTPETEVAKALLIKYTDVALANMVNVEKSTETLTVKGTTQEVNAYTNCITEKVFLDAIKAILTEARNDSQIKAIFPAEANIEAVLDEAIASLNEQTPADDKDDAIVLVTYADKESNVLGRKLSTPAFSISHIALPTASGSVSETFIGDAQNNFRLEGSHTSGSTYTLFITSAGQSIEIGMLALSGDEKAGVCEITLSDFIEQNLFGTTDTDITLKVQWNMTDTSAAIDLSLNLMSQQLVAVRCSASLNESKDVTVPSDYLSADNPEDEQVYLDSINTYELMNNMLAIGFPSEYIDAVLNYLEGTPAE